jgi:hypothetical protein
MKALYMFWLINTNAYIKNLKKAILVNSLHLQIRFLAIADDRHVRCFSSYPLHFRRYRSSSQRMKFDRCFLTNKQRSSFIVKHDYIF